MLKTRISSSLLLRSTSRYSLVISVSLDGVRGAIHTRESRCVEKVMPIESATCGEPGITLSPLQPVIQPRPTRAVYHALLDSDPRLYFVVIARDGLVQQNPLSAQEKCEEFWSPRNRCSLSQHSISAPWIPPSGYAVNNPSFYSCIAKLLAHWVVTRPMEGFGFS